MRLESLAEPDFRAFMAKLTPNVPKENMLGVRIPKLRKLAKELAKTDWREQCRHPEAGTADGSTGAMEVL